MPWCITNGVAWLFGMLQKTANGYQSVHLDEPIVLNDGFEDENSSLKDILKVLSVWVRPLLFTMIDESLLTFPF
jgi:hypothetical protein